MSHGGTPFTEFRVPEAPVITVTPNPALDRTLRVDTLSFGGIARVQGVQEDPGGKGINVSRVLRQFGCPTTALGFLGGSAGRFLTDAMAKIRLHLAHAFGCPLAWYMPVGRGQQVQGEGRIL